MSVLYMAAKAALELIRCCYYYYYLFIHSARWRMVLTNFFLLLYIIYTNIIINLASVYRRHIHKSHFPTWTHIRGWWWWWWCFKRRLNMCDIVLCAFLVGIGNWDAVSLGIEYGFSWLTSVTYLSFENWFLRLVGDEAALINVMSLFT